MPANLFNGSTSPLVIQDTSGGHAQAVGKCFQEVFNATIGNGSNSSDAIDLGVFRAVGIVTPSAITGTILSFTVSFDGVNFVPLHDASGAIISTNITASRHIALNPSNFYGVRYLRLISNSNEAASRVFNIIAEA